MLKPPINNLVEKISKELGPELGVELGNRYSLVLAIAKRARDISDVDDKSREKEDSAFENRLGDKNKTKEVIKPIHKAIDELDAQSIEIYHKSPEEIKASKLGAKEEPAEVEFNFITEIDEDTEE